jgi:hypothetical protein
MVSFVKKTVLFFVLVIFFIEAFSFVLISTNIYLFDYPGNEIYYSILKSKKKNKSKKLLLGDSVCNQLFPNKKKNGSINSLACNQAIGMVGHFLLLQNYLDAGNKIDTLYMIFTPFSFQNNLDQRYTYHYFIKPFDRPEYSRYFTKTVKKQIEKIPYRKFRRIPHIFASSWTPDYIPKEKHDFTFLSPVTVEYLTKIKDLTIQNNIKLIILPPPINLNKQHLIDDMDRYEIAGNNFQDDFQNYFDKIIYLDSTKFIDGTHLIYPENYTEIYEKEISGRKIKTYLHSMLNPVR